ncbi:response regulator [Myxococcota bacterium]|nr:response regulator [Myxococcota bacterium]MBU1431264.1 response regulator [Myxococcota bacterium]MBU1898047.1 response regulator [Myxococcota bacterium]
MNALVIDDSTAMRLILRGILQDLGFEVSVASDGLEGFEMLPQLAAKLNVILVDWNMPNMDGYAFLRQVRKDKAYRKIPVLMVTSESDIKKIQKAFAVGASEYLMKPFTAEALREKLELVGVLG